MTFLRVSFLNKEGEKPWDIHNNDSGMFLFVFFLLCGGTTHIQPCLLEALLYSTLVFLVIPHTAVLVILSNPFLSFGSGILL